MQCALGHWMLTLLLAATLNAADSGSADEATQRFQNTNHQFAITLGPEWKEVDAKSAPYAKDVLDLSGDTACLAYQLASETNFAGMVFVQVDNQWRIPESDLARLEIDLLRQRFLTERLEVKGLLDSSYDTNTRVLRISSAIDMPAAGRVRLLEAIHFTDKGSIIVSCVAPVAHFKSVGVTFARALDTFHVDSSLAYHPRPGAERASASTSGTRRVRFRFGWIFAFAGVVLFLGRRWANRVTTDEI